MEMATSVGFGSRYDDDVGGAPGNRVIAGRALVRLGGMDGLQDPHVDLTVGPRSNSGNEVGDVTRRVIIVNGQPRWG